MDAAVLQAPGQANEPTLAFSPAALSAVIKFLRQAELDGLAAAVDRAAGKSDQDITRGTHVACNPTKPSSDPALPSGTSAVVTTTDVGGC